MDELKEKILTQLINDLSENFLNDKEILQNILEDVIDTAIYVSNRNYNSVNISLLKPEIKKCTKVLYLQRGVEDTKSLSEGEKNSSFVNAYEELRNDIIKNRKRVIK